MEVLSINKRLNFFEQKSKCYFRELNISVRDYEDTIIKNLDWIYISLHSFAFLMRSIFRYCPSF